MKCIDCKYFQPWPVLTLNGEKSGGNCELMERSVWDEYYCPKSIEAMIADLEAARKENAILNRMVEAMAKKGGASYEYYRAKAEKEQG